MGSDFSLDKYCTAALPIEKNHKVDEDPLGESSELLHEAQQKATSPKTTFNTTKRRSSGSNSNTTSSSKSSRNKNNKYLDLPFEAPSDDEFDSLEHAEAGANDSLNVPSNSTKTKSKSKTRPRSKSSSKPSSSGNGKRKKHKDKGSKRGRTRSKTRDRRNTDPARSPSRSPSRSPTPSAVRPPGPVTILIPDNNAGLPPKLSLLSSTSPKHTSNSSTSSKGSLRISQSGVAYYQHKHQSMTPTGTNHGYDYNYRAGKRHSYHKYHNNKRARVGRKGRGSAATDSIHEELEEYEIQSKQDKHEKDILKAEIMRLRLELGKYQQYQQASHNMGYGKVSHRVGKHASAVSGPATYTYPTAPKVLRMSTEPVPKFTDHEITEFEGNGTERTYSKKGSYHSTADDGNNGFPVNGTPKTPISKSHTSSPSHSRSVSKSGSADISSNNAPQNILSPLSPLSENMQHIILAFPTTFPEIDGKQQ